MSENLTQLGLGQEWDAYRQEIENRLALKQLLAFEDDGGNLGQFPYFFEEEPAEVHG